MAERTCGLHPARVQLNALLAPAGHRFSTRTAFPVDNNQANQRKHLATDVSRVELIFSMSSDMLLDVAPTFYENVVKNTEMLKAAKSNINYFCSSPANDS